MWSGSQARIPTIRVYSRGRSIISRQSGSSGISSSASSPHRRRVRVEYTSVTIQDLSKFLSHQNPFYGMVTPRPDKPDKIVPNGARLKNCWFYLASWTRNLHPLSLFVRDVLLTTIDCHQLASNLLNQSWQMMPWQTEGVQALHPKGVPPKSNASGSSILKANEKDFL